MNFNLIFKPRKIEDSKKRSALIRHILKTISYRILGSSITVITALCLGAPIEISTLIGLAELVIKPLIYFAHERFWYKFLTIGNK